MINLLSGFFVPFSVISVLRSARCMSLSSVGVIEYVDHHAHPAVLSFDQENVTLCLTHALVFRNCRAIKTTTMKKSTCGNQDRTHLV